jgi:PilZ domain
MPAKSVQSCRRRFRDRAWSTSPTASILPGEALVEGELFGEDADRPLHSEKVLAQADALDDRVSRRGSQQLGEHPDMVVPLPAPLGPRKPKRRPRATRKVKWSTARCRRNTFVRFSTTRACSSFTAAPPESHRVIDLCYVSFTSMPEKRVERRRTRRVPMKLPVRVQGRDPDGRLWEEMARCEDASASGVGLLLKRPVRVGQVLYLALPLPSHFRQYDLTEPSYRVYALVRGRRDGNPARLGLLFIGKQPPKGAEALPTELFFLPGDPRPTAADRPTVSLVLRLEAEHAPGGVAREQRALADNVTPRTADVKAGLPVGKGAILTVSAVDGDFKTRAEVRAISIEKDGQPRLSLLFLDDPLPDRLLPPDARDKTPPEA